MAKEKRILAKGYVCPYNVVSHYALTVIFVSGFVGIGVYLAPYSSTALLHSMMLALLLCLIPLAGFAFDRAAMRYYVTDTYVKSCNLFGTRCQLKDSEVKQIELQWSFEIWKDFVSKDAIHLVCSDSYYAQVKYISRKFHRKNQVVVRITRKNFPAVQAYLSRMGIAAGVTNYDSLVQLLRYHPNMYRNLDGAWTLQ